MKSRNFEKSTKDIAASIFYEVLFHGFEGYSDSVILIEFFERPSDISEKCHEFRSNSIEKQRIVRDIPR